MGERAKGGMWYPWGGLVRAILSCSRLGLRCELDAPGYSSNGTSYAYVPKRRDHQLENRFRGHPGYRFDNLTHIDVDLLTVEIGASCSE